MHKITYIGTDFDQSESVTLDGVTYKRGKAVKADEVHPHLVGNPTFRVEEDEVETKETEEKTEEKEEVKAPAKRTRKPAEKETK